jgi:hypothetical protein
VRKQELTSAARVAAAVELRQEQCDVEDAEQDSTRSVGWRRGSEWHVGSSGGRRLWQNQPELYRLKYASPLPRAPTCFKRYNPLACRVTSR